MKDTSIGAVTEFVLDASSIIALLAREKGFEKVAAVVDTAKMSAVNLAEAGSHLTEAGYSLAQAQAVLSEIPVHVVPFDEEQAMETARLRALTRSLRLSLSDRACLALARKLRLPAMTADHAWGRLNIGVHVTVIR